MRFGGITKNRNADLLQCRPINESEDGTYVGLRILYGIAYIAGWGAVRSSLWGLGLACMIGLFIIAAL